MPNRVLKPGLTLALTTVIAVWGAGEAWPTPVQLDVLAITRMHDATERRTSLDSWRLARLGPLASGRDEQTTALEPSRMVRLRPRSAILQGMVRNIDADVFLATPGGDPISDSYDFAGADLGGFAPITPVETKKAKILKAQSPQRTPESTQRGTPPSVRPDKALVLGVKTFDYMALTTRIFVKNIARFLKIVP